MEVRQPILGMLTLYKGSRATETLLTEWLHYPARHLRLAETSGAALAARGRPNNTHQLRSQILLDEAASRIMTIAAVHHRLYAGGSLTMTDAALYLSGLLSDMRGMLPDMTDDRALTLKMEPFSLAAADIAPLGLITCELVTNALKYGAGSVEVAVVRNATGLEISVSDEGDGFPADFDPMDRRGLGMRMVGLLAKATKGEAITVDRSVGFGRVIVRAGFGGV